MTTRLFSIALLKVVLKKILQQALVFALIVALQGNVVWAQGPAPPEMQNETADPDAAQQPQPAAPPAQSSAPSQQPAPAPPGDKLVLPAGTRLPLGLLRPLSTRRSKPGSLAYLQITFPVVVGGQMAVPPGTYVQGVIDKVTVSDRPRGLLQLELRSISMIFSNGYTANFGGSASVEPYTAGLRPQPVPGNGQGVPALNAAGTTTPAPLPMPSLGNGPRIAAIAVGASAAVFTGLLIWGAHRSDVEMEAGTPLEIILSAPLELDRDRVMAAVQQYAGQMANNAPPPIVQPPVKPKMCYDPGSPGTPDTVIPGTPGTPSTTIPGMNGAPDITIPGTPPTPPTVIPGTPGTPASEYPCK